MLLLFTWLLSSVSHSAPHLNPEATPSPLPSPSPSGYVDSELGFRPDEDIDGADDASVDPSLFSEEKKYFPKHKSKQAKMAIQRALGKLALAPVAAPLAGAHAAMMLNYSRTLSQRPELFKLFEIHRGRYIPATENGSTVVNMDDAYIGINDNKFGLCEGVSSLNRYFTVLAFFDSDPQAGLKLGENIPPSRTADHTGWIKFYKRKIRRVLSAHATLIPGFKNFRELSLDPELEVYLKQRAVSLWVNRVSSIKQAKLALASTEPMSAEKRNAMVTDLRQRLSRNELPNVLITQQINRRWHGLSLMIHSLLVYDIVDRDDGSIRIMVWDPDFFTESHVEDPKFIEIRPHGQILYLPYYEAKDKLMSDRIARVEIAPDNDTDTIRMLLSLAHFCKGAPSYCETPR